MIYRQLEKKELPKYLDHLLRLDQDSRYLRFGHPVSNSGIEHFIMLVERNFKEHVIYTAINDDYVQGIAHVALTDKIPEFALSVDREIRRQGHASHLARMGLTYLRNHGFREAVMHCLSNNEPAINLIRKMGATTVTHGPDSSANISIPFPTPGTVAEEFHNNMVLVVDKMLSKQEAYMSMLFGRDG